MISQHTISTPFLHRPPERMSHRSILFFHNWAHGLGGSQQKRDFLQALTFTSCIQPLKHPNIRLSSYGLKHTAENLAFSLPQQVELSKHYVSDTDLIAAALHSGFNAHSPEYDRGYFNNSPNPEFNMSERSIKPLLEQREKQRVAS